MILTAQIQIQDVVAIGQTEKHPTGDTSKIRRCKPIYRLERDFCLTVQNGIYI